jgi:hypothetical protein
MNTYLPATDPSLPDVRVEWAIAKAEFAARGAARSAAEQLAAIHETLSEARDFPSVYLGPGSADSQFAERAAVADLAVRLSISENTVRSQAAQASTLMRCTPRVWFEFRDGLVSAANARTVAELADTLDDPALHAAFDEAVVGPAQTLAPARFRTRARGIRERLEPQRAEERHARQMEQRGVWIDPHIDGMAWLSAYLPAHIAQRAMAAVDHVALGASPDDPRTLEQRRADAFGDLLIGPRGARTVGVRVAVTVPVLALLGHDDEGGTLDGYGPIDPATARELAAEAPSFTRILTHPVSSTVLDVDRTTYRPPADLARWLRVRDVECGFIGCGRVAANCDIDHTVPWAAGGHTSADNLMHLCRHHHRLKHESGWSVTRGQDGRAVWRSPTGLVRTADPPPY